MTVSGGAFRVDGFILRASDSRPWQYKAITAFDLFHQYCDNKDIVPFLNWAKTTGANTLRVFGMWSVTGFDVNNYIDYQNKIPNFCGILAAHGFYVDFVIFTDADKLMRNLSDQLDHYAMVTIALSACPNAIAQVCNEPFKNGVDVTQVGWKIPGLIQSSGDYGTDGDFNNIKKTLDIGNLHSYRGDSQVRKMKDIADLRDGYTGFSGLKKPCVNDEPFRLENVSEMDAATAGVLAQFFGVGACAHSITIEFCNIPNGQENNNIRLFHSALLPADISIWAYSRGEFDGSSNSCPMYHTDDIAERTYAKIRGNEAYCQIVNGTDANPRSPTNGWFIKYALGHDLFYLER